MRCARRVIPPPGVNRTCASRSVAVAPGVSCAMRRPTVMRLPLDESRVSSHERLKIRAKRSDACAAPRNNKGDAAAIRPVGLEQRRFARLCTGVAGSDRSAPCLEQCLTAHDGSSDRSPVHTRREVASSATMAAKPGDAIRSVPCPAHKRPRGAETLDGAKAHFFAKSDEKPLFCLSLS